MNPEVHPRHLRPHATFGDDPSGWCGCAECDPRETCGCQSCVTNVHAATSDRSAVADHGYVSGNI